MINSLRLNNFKPFANQLLNFRPLTLLSGLNSTGKSSVLQALLLLRQSYQQDLLPDKGLALNGELVTIGTGKDALFEGAEEDSISFEITWENHQKSRWSFNYNREVDVMEIDSSQASDDIYQASLFNDNFHYLTAERIGSRPYFEISDYQVRQHRQLGIRGEYTAHFLAIYRDEKIYNQELSHPQANSMELRDQVEAWMGEISPGTRLEIQSNPGLDLVSLQYSYGLSSSYRSTNVGFGITYTLPIIVAILSSEPGTLIILENPEAHLHPKGQSQMGKLLAFAANCGVQIVTETHSDHILNGIRLAVRDLRINPEDVQLHYFQREYRDDQFFTDVNSPNINKNGKIDIWPDGFFDQIDKDSLELI